jgi:hypothetical protein
MPAEPEKRRGGLTRLVTWLVVVGLLGAVLWLASDRNQRRYSWTVDSGKLVISKGRFFPTGQETIAPDDPKLGPVYGPVAVPQGAKISDQEFDDQTALDRALLDLVLPWAKADLQKGDEPSMAEANALADRLSALPGLTADQYRALSGVRSDLSFASAKGELVQATKLVLSARRKLEAVRQSGSDHALEAGPVVRELAGIQEALEQAVQGRATGAFAPRAPPADAGQSSGAGAGTTSPAGATSPGGTTGSAQVPTPGPPPGLNPSNPPAAQKPGQR